MSCQICFNLYDHSIHRPFILSCPHTFCLRCINKLEENRCPTCNIYYKKIHPNIALLDFVPESNYDRLKKDSIRAINDINELKILIRNERDKLLKEYSAKIKTIKNRIINETFVLINLIKSNQEKLLTEANSIEKTLKKNLSASLKEKEIEDQMINSKLLIEKNKFREEKLINFGYESPKIKAEFEKIANELKEYKENIDLVIYENIILKNGLIGEIRSNEKQYKFFRKKAEQEILQNNYQEAINNLDKAFEVCPIKNSCNKKDYFENKGSALFNLQMYQDSICCYQKCIDLDSNDFLSYSNIGVAYINLGKNDEALIYLNKSTEINPNSHFNHRTKGIVYMQNQNYQNALTCFNRSIALDPHNYEYIVLKGDCLEKLNRIDDAIECFKQAIELNANYAPAYFSKAKCFYERNAFHLALVDIDEACELSPLNKQYKMFKRDIEKAKQDSERRKSKRLRKEPN